ncbi:conserved exported hypothetical protein [Candidatus Defluviicoccus seviourii]|uniref:DUF3576 domain-containing protein n=1 Tax=Candidatus Defluviicoccus seviourii TaxID=2565273 RepID=A0A564WC68_9PROT|nr:conserved exported hypothetical protein [Candidatus Defluviicoccus seviourii]
MAFDPRASGAIVRAFAIGLACFVAFATLSACSDAKVVSEYPDKDPLKGDYKPQYGKRDSVFGSGGLVIGGDAKAAPEEGEGGGGGIGVNGFLWRASLDTISFMPVASADPFGGVIITDWYAMPEAPKERFKLTIYILGRSLRSDAVKAAVFRQVHEEGGNWVDTKVAADAPAKIEDAILTRARQLRFAALQK